MFPWHEKCLIRWEDCLGALGKKLSYAIQALLSIGRTWSYCRMDSTGQPYPHRRSRRVKMGQPVKLASSDPRGEVFEDIETTKNVSVEGLYFISQRTSYHEGMRLFVTLPYHSPLDSRNREYLGQIIRVEPLEGGQRGVAVQFLSSRATSGRDPGGSKTR